VVKWKTEKLFQLSSSISPYQHPDQNSALQKVMLSWETLPAQQQWPAKQPAQNKLTA